MSDNFDTFDINTYICDTVIHGPGQGMGSSETQSTQGWDKIDKALATKRTDPTLINQVKTCDDYIARKNQIGGIFWGYSP